MKTKLAILSVLFGALSYLILIVETAKGTGEGLSLATFALWSALAWITIITMLKQKANPAVPIVYGLGATTTTIILIMKGKFGWTSLDVVVGILTVICIVLWLTNGPRWAFVLSIASGSIAAIPFIVMTWSQPENSPIIPNLGMLVANIFSFVSAKTWKLEDRLYSGVNIVLGTILIVPWVLLVMLDPLW